MTTTSRIHWLAIGLLVVAAILIQLIAWLQRRPAPPQRFSTLCYDRGLGYSENSVAQIAAGLAKCHDGNWILLTKHTALK